MIKIGYILEIVGIVAFIFLTSIISYKIINHIDPLIIILAIITSYITSDFVTGFVHWLADRYGKKNIPFIGPHFIAPFRAHHLDPLDIIKHNFISTNGNSSLITLPVLIIALLLPINQLFIVTFLMFLCCFAMISNQFHKWAHIENPPTIIKYLQRYHLILTHDIHAIHHISPYSTYYCMTTGWLNKFLQRVEFFERLEKLLTKFGIEVDKS